MRVAPANAADCLIRDPKSAVAAIMRRIIGANIANSAATLPRQQAEHGPRSRGRRSVSRSRLTTISLDEGGSVDRRPAAEPGVGTTRGREAGASVGPDPTCDQHCAGCTRIALEPHLRHREIEEPGQVHAGTSGQNTIRGISARGYRQRILDEKQARKGPGIGGTQCYRSPALDPNVPDRPRAGVGACEDDRNTVGPAAGGADNPRARGNREIAFRDIIYARLQVDASVLPYRHPPDVVPGNDDRVSDRPDIDRGSARGDMAIEKRMRQDVCVRVGDAGRTDQRAWGRAEFRWWRSRVDRVSMHGDLARGYQGRSEERR